MAENGRVQPRVAYGRVKWFDPTKGFGFVVAEGVESDILLHVNVLRNFGQSSVADNAWVEIAVQRTERGMQATEVFHIEPPADAGTGVLEDLVPREEALREAPLVPARVKWFDKVRGFGFANVFGRPEDVFVHVEVLRLSGLADLQPGEAVGVHVVEGRRGMMATRVTPWEAALH